MYLKCLKLKNYRKFSTEQNVIEFISSKIVKNQVNASDGAEVGEIDDAKEIDVASDTTLIIGKNNAGKTTIITALDNIVNHESEWGVNDFNYWYLQTYLNEYDVTNPPKNAPYIEFLITIALEEDSGDRVSNLIPFMLVEDVNYSELDIGIRYEIVDLASFQDEMKKLFLESDVSKDLFPDFIQLLHNTDYTLNYYDKTWKKIDTKFKLSNLIELKCIKANHIKNDHCLTEAFNKIINYRYEHFFKNEKKTVTDELGTINNTLTSNISNNHTVIIQDVLKNLVSTDHMGVRLSADITFEKLMKDLIRYEYIENGANIPESQFGLGYTNLIMIVAAIMDYMEHYPESSFNSKINLISIEEPETFMHPQMQELFIKNINEAIRVLLESKDKDVNSQIIITTHSSHILNSKIHSANTFNNICYLHEKDNFAQISNLNNDKIMPTLKGDIDESENTEDNRDKIESFKFLKKHIKYKVSELFFSDAAIFVEGFAEDIILPFYIEKRDKLNKYYISVFNINGAHGYLYRDLILALGIPVLIITDLDIQREDECEEAVDEEDKGEGKTKKKNIEQIECLMNQRTTNTTIKKIYGTEDLTNIPKNIDNNNLYLAYQGKINGYYATSFEEAFILENYDNELVNKLLSEIKPKIYKRIVGKPPVFRNNILHSYEWQVKLEKSKGEFASKLLYGLVNENEDKLPKLPKYISDGLDWIEKELGGTNGVI